MINKYDRPQVCIFSRCAESIASPLCNSLELNLLAESVSQCGVSSFS
jgi:hypothetical protein